MPINSDNSVSLPTPPPPRPAERRDAIEAALRKFDEAAGSPRERPSRSWWAGHQRQLGALATAAVIALVSVPVAVIVLQNQPKPAPNANVPTPVKPKQSSPAASNITLPSAPAADQSAAAEVPRSMLPLEPHGEAARVQETEERKAQDAPVLGGLAAAPPVPPQPPPPAPPPAPERDEAANMATGQDMIVTGSRIPAPAPPSTQHGQLAAKRAADAASPIALIDAHDKFLSRLQSAIRSDNRRAVSALIAFPLRVNTNTGPRTYPSRKDVEEDFDRIFTPRVKQAILKQRSDSLFVRDQGAMIGNGEVWFDRTCSNPQCYPPGPVRIKAVNP